MEFRILGSLEVVHEGRPLAVGGSRERAVLTVLLASANRVVSTERLAEDLWGSSPPEQPGRSLQVFVSRLRKALREAGGDGIVVTRSSGYLVCLPPSDVDALRFEALVGDARQQAGAGVFDQAAATFRQALGLWRGPALIDVADGIHTRAEAARLDQERLAAMEECMDAELACGHHAEVAAELDTLTRTHPLRERLWGQRMLALYRCGRQVEALRAYQDLRTLLAEDVGLEPGPALVALEKAILQHSADLDWCAPGTEAPSERDEPVHAVATAFAAKTPYVGREAERAQLRLLLDNAATGHGSLVLIGGEPGLGKTRLTEELGEAAGARGFQVLVGRCYEIDGAPPYVPFVEILEQALAGASSPEAFRMLLGEDAPEVAKLLPRLRRLFPDMPPPLELPPEQERHYLFNSVRDCLARAAADVPLYLVFEDLHWADEGALLLLEHLAENLPGIAVLGLATYRDNEVTPDHPLARPLEHMLGRRLAERIRLHRFGEDGVAALLGGLSGQEPPEALVKAVHAETQGNPFFTEEVFRHLAEEGRLYGDDGRLRPVVDIGDLDVPESLRLVLGRRLERLGPNGRRALSAAAVIGRAFTYELLEALGDLPADALLDSLTDAERARLIAPLSDAPDEDRLLFSHELIRQTLLADLSQPRRRRLHLLVADTLERLHAGSLDEQSSEIAHHLTQAGSAADRRRLLDYVTRAGRQALRTSGYEDALRHFEQAMSLIEVADPAQRPALFADRALARRSVGRLEDALPDWNEALEGYEGLDEPEAAARVCLELSRDFWWLNRDRESLAAAKRGLSALTGRETPQRAEMLAWTGVAGAWVSEFDPGARMIDEGLALAERLGEKRLVGYSIVTRALHRFAFSLQHEVLTAGQEGLRRLRAEGDLWEVATLLGFMEAAALELGQLEHAAQLGDELLPLATRLGHIFAQYLQHGFSQHARVLITEPDLDALEASARHLSETAGPMGYRHITTAMQAHVAFLRGSWDEALERAEEAVRHAPERHATSGMEWGCYLRVLAYRGDATKVMAVLESRRAELPQPGRPNGYGPWFVPAAAIEALYAVGEREQAAGFYPLVREFMTTTGIVLPWFCPYLVQRIAGIGATAGGQWEVAEAHFQAALHQAEELPFPIEAAETRRFYARMLLDRNAQGDGDRARLLVEEALPIYKRIGMPRHEQLARDLMIK